MKKTNQLRQEPKPRPRQGDRRVRELTDRDLELVQGGGAGEDTPICQKGREN